MDDQGELGAVVMLADARTARGITLDQVARETHISVRYLEGLETGDYSVFPGPAYVTGFIRSYASYLELDPQPLVDRYRMQRSEVLSEPEEFSVARAQRSPLMAVVVLALLVFGAGVFALVRWVLAPMGVVERSAEGVSDATVRPFVMASNAVIRVLEIGTVLHIPLGDRAYQVLLARYEEGLLVEYGGNEVSLTIGSEALLDLDGDAKADLRMLFNSVDQNGPTVRVTLTLERAAGMDQAWFDDGAGDPDRLSLS